MRILGVSGSLRESSFNTGLLRAAAEAAPDGVELELWNGLAELPLYDQELDGDDAPAPVQRLREAWGAADAILFATPEYNGSVPGGLKNAIDWASRPVRAGALHNKTVAVVGASTGQFGALWAQQDLKRILGIAGARVVGWDPRRPRARAVRQRGPSPRRRAVRATAPPSDDARRGSRSGRGARRRLIRDVRREAQHKLVDLGGAGFGKAAVRADDAEPALLENATRCGVVGRNARVQRSRSIDGKESLEGARGSALPQKARPIQ